MTPVRLADLVSSPCTTAKYTRTCGCDAIQLRHLSNSGLAAPASDEGRVLGCGGAVLPQPHVRQCHELHCGHPDRSQPHGCVAGNNSTRARTRPTLRRARATPFWCATAGGQAHVQSGDRGAADLVDTDETIAYLISRRAIAHGGRFRRPCNGNAMALDVWRQDDALWRRRPRQFVLRVEGADQGRALPPKECAGGVQAR